MRARYQTIRAACLVKDEQNPNSRNVHLSVTLKTVMHQTGAVLVMRQRAKPTKLGGNWDHNPVYVGDNLLMATDAYFAEVQRWKKLGYFEQTPGPG